VPRPKTVCERHELCAGHRRRPARGLPRVTELHTRHGARPKNLPGVQPGNNGPASPPGSIRPGFDHGVDAATVELITRYPEARTRAPAATAAARLTGLIAPAPAAGRRRTENQLPTPRPNVAGNGPPHHPHQTSDDCSPTHRAGIISDRQVLRRTIGSDPAGPYNVDREFGPYRPSWTAATVGRTVILPATSTATATRCADRVTP
jgi:hypothetical protein